MASAPDPFVDQLIDDLCGTDPERQYRAWEKAVDVLRATPERIAGGLCEVVDSFLGSDRHRARAGPTLFVLANHTARRPDLVPLQTLERWLGAPQRLDAMGLLSTLTMLSRLRPDLIAGPYYRLALEATLEHPVPSAELWSNVGRDQPDIVLEIAEVVFEQAGWDTPLAAAVVSILKRLGAARPDQIDAMVAVVQAAAHREPPPEPGTIRLRTSNLSSPDQVIAELHALRDAAARPPQHG
jgi:hypothetical protein